MSETELKVLDDDTDTKIQENLFKNYDLTIDISYIYNVDKKPWKIKIGNNTLSKELSKIVWNGLVITVEGLYNKGKTFVLNNLINALKEKFTTLNSGDLVEGETVNTEGLSFKFVECKGNNDKIGEEYIFLDTAGLQSPITSDEKKKEENKDNKEKKEEQEEEDYNTTSSSSEDEEHSARKRLKREKKSFITKIREKKILELFLNDIIFELSDFFIVVLEHLTTTDQEFVENIIQKLSNTKEKEYKKIDRIHIIHNFLKVTTLEEAHKIWKKEVLNVYKGGKLTEDGICYLFRKNKHVFLINNDSEEGKVHNLKVFKLLISWIKNDYPVGRKFRLIDNIEKKLSTVLKQYMTNIEGLNYNETNNSFEIKKIKNEESIKMNEIAIDVLTGLKISASDEFQATFDVYKIQKEKNNSELLIKIDMPDLSEINPYKRKQSRLITNTTEQKEKVEEEKVTEKGTKDKFVVRVNRQTHRIEILGERRPPTIPFQFTKDIQSTRKYGKISLHIPLLKLSSLEYYEYNKVQKVYENGVLTIIIPISKSEYENDENYDIL